MKVAVESEVENGCDEDWLMPACALFDCDSVDSILSGLELELDPPPWMRFLRANCRADNLDAFRGELLLDFILSEQLPTED